MSLCVAALCSLTTAQKASAQTNAAPARVTNRYLLIVETSRSMQNRSEGALRIAGDLFTSGMGGQVQRGDTIGLWTFSDTLHAGNFPLQAWTPAARTNMAVKVVNFLRAQKFEKKPHFDKVMPVLQQVVHNSDYITVIVICSGDAPINGTPFDARVNEFYTTWRSQQKAAHMPFVAILRAEKGKFADCAVHWAPWPVDLPALPQELLAARAVKPALAARPNPPASLPPVTFTGHKGAASVSPPAHQNFTPNPAPSAAALQPHNEAPATDTATSGGGLTTLAAQPPPPSTVQAENSTPASGLPTNGSPFKPQSFVASTPSVKTVDEKAPAPVNNPSTNSSVSAPASSIPPAVATAAETPAALISSLEKPANPPVAASSSVAILPSASLLNAKLLWLAAGLCLLLAALVFWRWREHARPPLHVSLITRSLEREQD